MHYLLATPFRYGAIYPKGSRFRRAGRTPGVFYASERPETAVAEMAFYRLLFYAESPATPWPSDAGEYTVFAAAVATQRRLDLTAAPLSRDRAAWIDPIDYAACQALADAARAAGAEVIRYASARDPAAGVNVAVLTVAAFAESKPLQPHTWRIRLSAAGVQAICAFPGQAPRIRPRGVRRRPEDRWDRMATVSPRPRGFNQRVRTPQRLQRGSA